MSLTSFDFQQARVKQVLFKSRLRSVLYGVREPEPALFALAENPVGQWIETVARPALGTSPTLREFEQTLQQMLHLGQELAARYQRGHIDEARAGLEGINSFADRMEAQLSSLEKLGT